MPRRSAEARRILDGDDSDDDEGHRGASARGRGGAVAIPSRPHAVSSSRVAVHPALVSRALSGPMPSSATLSSDSESELEQHQPASRPRAFHLEQARVRASLDSSSDNEEDEKESVPSSIDENWYLAESFGRTEAFSQTETKESKHAGKGAWRSAVTPPRSRPRTVTTPPSSPPKGAAKMIFVVTYPSLKDDPDSEIKKVVHSLDARDGKALTGDPPISADGVIRAQALARYFQDRGLERVYASPYLRSLQIAQHLAWAIKSKITLEPGLSNVPHTRIPLPSTLECFRAFPAIDLRHLPSSREPPPDETPLQSLPRMLDAGHDIAERMRAGQSVAVVTHSSSAMALAAGLVSGCRRSCYPQDAHKLRTLRSVLHTIDVGCMCGVYKLVYNAESEAWESDLRCHALYNNSAGDRTLLPLEPGEMRFLRSKFANIGASDWERQWRSSCDKHSDGPQTRHAECSVAAAP